jgi:hypothetical protein
VKNANKCTFPSICTMMDILVEAEVLDILKIPLLPKYDKTSESAIIPINYVLHI